MPLVIAALLLGAAANPPLDDGNKKPSAAASSPSLPASIDEDDKEEGRAQAKSTILVTARRLDEARNEFDAALGSSVYSLTNDAVENRPGGETGSVADILSQAPGVTLSNHGLNIRGAAANQVRINNVIIPEAIPDPALARERKEADVSSCSSSTPRNA